MLSPQGAHLHGEESRDWLAQRVVGRWGVVASDPDHTHRFPAWREDPSSTALPFPFCTGLWTGLNSGSEILYASMGQEPHVERRKQ